MNYQSTDGLGNQYNQGISSGGLADYFNQQAAQKQAALQLL